MSTVWAEQSYQQLDAGIRFAVRVLHAAGFDTGQSCQGGSGHSYKEPTIEVVAGADDAIGFGALCALRGYGLPVSEIALVWSISHSLPYEKNWRITFFKTMEGRANEIPIFHTVIIGRLEALKER